jgi:hypothetical protein
MADVLSVRLQVRVLMMRVPSVSLGTFQNWEFVLRVRRAVKHALLPTFVPLATQGMSSMARSANHVGQIARHALFQR